MGRILKTATGTSLTELWVICNLFVGYIQNREGPFLWESDPEAWISFHDAEEDLEFESEDEDEDEDDAQLPWEEQWNWSQWNWYQNWSWNEDYMWEKDSDCESWQSDWRLQRKHWWWWTTV